MAFNRLAEFEMGTCKAAAASLYAAHDIAQNYKGDPFAAISGCGPGLTS